LPWAINGGPPHTDQGVLYRLPGLRTNLGRIGRLSLRHSIPISTSSVYPRLGYPTTSRFQAVHEGRSGPWNTNIGLTGGPRGRYDYDPEDEAALTAARASKRPEKSSLLRSSTFREPALDIHGEPLPDARYAELRLDAPSFEFEVGGRATGHVSLSIYLSLFLPFSLALSVSPSVSPSPSLSPSLSLSLPLFFLRSLTFNSPHPHTPILDAPSFSLRRARPLRPACAASHGVRFPCIYHGPCESYSNRLKLCLICRRMAGLKSSTSY
jgi:hypothetical protein